MVANVLRRSNGLGLTWYDPMVSACNLYIAIHPLGSQVGPLASAAV